MRFRTASTNNSGPNRDFRPKRSSDRSIPGQLLTGHQLWYHCPGWRDKVQLRFPSPASSICHWQWNSRRCRWAASNQLFCCRFYRYDPYLASKEGSYSGANCKVSSGNAGAAEKLNEYETCYCPIEKRPCHRMQGRLFHAF